MLDSTTNHKLYADRAAELGQKAIGYSEHGVTYSWVEKKMYADSQGLKFLFCIEIYLTESLEPKVRDNYHTVLVAKNYAGVQEINELIELSTRPDHFYYKPRITFDEFLALSDNVIKISACLASPLNRIRENNPLETAYDYYEVQPHVNSQDQIEYNQYLFKLSKKNGIPLIAGTDTHNINQYKAECRSILQKAKHIEFSNEDEFDLTYKTYDELVDMFARQGALPAYAYLEAIENTNRMADSVEPFELDTSFKYPVVEDARNKLWQITVDRYNEKVRDKIIADDPQYLANAEEEIRILETVGMCGFMYIMSDIMTWCRASSIPFSPCRGSVGGSTIAYLTDITDVDPIMWHTVFSRFCNESRVEIGDIDVDISPDQRDLVYQYIIDKFGDRYCAYILASGTVSDKGTIDEIGRALGIELGKVDKIKEEYEANPEKARNDYPRVFYYFDGLVNTVVSQSMHPAGIVASPVDLIRDYGTFWSKGKRILCINMEEVHEISLVKYDILGLKNIQILRNCCELAGIAYPRAHEIDWDDDAVWSDITVSPVGLFQFESGFAFDSLKRFRPHSINDVSLVTAAIRPSGGSYRDRLLSHETNKNPSRQIDDLLSENRGFLVFQEDVIKFLQQICGLSGGEADNVRRAIGRKQVDRLEAALPSILEGYCNVSERPRIVAEEEAKEFLQIIEDSSSYMFGYNHATGYSLVTYLCAYFRYYYPIEFVTAYLNNANTDDDIANGVELARVKKIKVLPIKFGKSRASYFMDKENNAIYKGCGSVKWMSAEVAEKLYELSQQREYNSFSDLLYDIKQTGIDSRQINILTELDYFSDFGNSRELSCVIRMFDFMKWGDAKLIAKTKIEPHSDLYDALVSHSIGVNDKGVELKSWKVLNAKAVLVDMEAAIKARGMEDYDIRYKVKAQMEYMGHVASTGREEDRSMLLIKNVFPAVNRKTGEQFGIRVTTHSIGSGIQAMFTIRNPALKKYGVVNKGDVIRCLKKDLDRGWWQMYAYKKL